MNNHLFRKTSLDKISSPEQLNEYIRVSTPSVWMVLAAIIVLLAGVCVWGIFGHLETTVNVPLGVENGEAVVLVKEEKIASVKEGMSVRAENMEGKVKELVSVRSGLAMDFFSTGDMDRFGLHRTDEVYFVPVEISLPDGEYTAEIVVESISPIAFVLN